MNRAIKLDPRHAGAHNLRGILAAEADDPAAARLVGINEGKATARQLEYDGQSTVTLDRETLGALSPFSTVVAIIAYDEPTELVGQYAAYTLKVNGVTQPGGGG